MANFTTIDDPSAHFQVATWTGDGSTSDRNIANDGNSDLAPDFIWGACRTDVQAKMLFDSSRGFSTGDKELVSSYNNVEGDTSAYNTGAYGWLGPSITDGFVSNYGSVNNGYWNVSSRTYVAWQWKGAGGTTSTNNDGDIASTVQVNSTAGFSIVQYSPSNATARSIGHGLGVKPQVVIVRARNRVEDGRVFHRAAGTTGALTLNSTATYNSNTNLFASDSTSTVFNVGTDFSVNGAYNYVAWCFAEIQGYSKFGSYKGNYQTSAPYNGPFVHCGFQPAFVMIKRSDSANDWIVFDHKRDEDQGGNVCNPYVRWNTTDAEVNHYYTGVDMLSNGFKVRGYDGNANANGTYVYMAFAEHPFVTSTGVPNTAR